MRKSKDKEQGEESLEPKVERYDQKIEVEIRHIVRVKPEDFKAVRDSFEEWALKWD
jgi:hypothetical protein